jgi:hypothetical protein
MDAFEEFQKIFGDVVMSDNDAAWYIFKAGWNAARVSNAYAHPFTCKCDSCRPKLSRMIDRFEDRERRRVRETED